MRLALFALAFCLAGSAAAAPPEFCRQHEFGDSRPYFEYAMGFFWGRKAGWDVTRNIEYWNLFVATFDSDLKDEDGMTRNGDACTLLGRMDGFVQGWRDRKELLGE